ncbi:MAG: hypothetical protein JWQ25_2634, partial [Daejeonella sp.]|nr:hypothetical protein [Daejeonella sp.]
MQRLRILTFISVILAIGVYQLKHREPSTEAAGEGLLVPNEWLKTNKISNIPNKDIRPADQTFLTYPEWFLVFSPAEQADYLKTNTSTTFPYLNHISQLWQGYSIVYDQIKGNYKFNTGYHVMIWVIALSTTVEYGIKSFYETFIGGFTNPNPKCNLTEEDQFNARYMQSYVTFIETTPWYEYNFTQLLHELWTETPLKGDHFLRKLERRYYLTTELFVKAAYGWLIKLGTKSAYDAALLNTSVIIDNPFHKGHYPTGVSFSKLIPNGLVMDFPRYAPFKEAAIEIAKDNIKFKEIAGNGGAILLTVLTKNELKIRAEDVRLLFTQPIITQPGTKRLAM